ncbi:OpgC domain-containing protein [Elioraea sp.]|uniref:OpgC domain-containing protein n=1 Tax=Elioraea sp. TaxID=2185103 RepID=UPI0025B7A848|nr:OpgC domain-containing protein [Elioraea sp.]
MTSPIALTQGDFLARLAARGTGRDRAIDIARGIALVAILNTHFSLMARDIGSLGGVRVPFLSDVQFPDFADFFVFLSGYVYGLVYGGRIVRDGLASVIRQTIRRMGQIMRAMITATAIAVALSWILISDSGALRRLDVWQFQANGRLALYDLLSFTSAPLFINILCLYVLLLIAAPFLVWGFRRHLAATFGVSIVVWLLVQAGPLAITSTWAGMHSFNPFAWQLLFAMGIFLGMQRGFDTILATLSRRATLGLALACLGFFVVRMVMKLSPEAYAALTPLSGKAELAAVRIANFICLAPVFVLFVGWLERALPFLAGWLARLGALSLEMFAAGVVLSLVMAAGFLALGGGVAAYLAVLSAGLAAYLFGVKLMELLS